MGKGVGYEPEVAAVVGPFAVEGDDEIDGNHLRALVDELEEGVLAVDAGFAPNGGAGGEIHGLAVAVAAFAVAFHIELLEVGRQAAQAVAVGDDDVAGAAAEVLLPDADEGEQGGDVAPPRGVQEVLVHIVPAAQEFAEMFAADGAHHGQADGRPHGIAPAHPVEHAEHLLRGDAEFGSGFHIGRYGGEVLLDIGFAAAGLQKPAARGLGVEQGFGGAEGFAGHDKQRGFGRYAAQDAV